MNNKSQTTGSFAQKPWYQDYLEFIVMSIS